MASFYVNLKPNQNEPSEHHEIHAGNVCCVHTTDHRGYFESAPEKSGVFNAAWDRLEDEFSDGITRKLDFCCKCLKIEGSKVVNR